jgi:hypothetical protein
VIARLAVAVPFTLLVPDKAVFKVYSYEDEGYTVSVLCPGKSNLPLHADTPTTSVIDGKPAFVADTIQIEFRKDSFNRTDATIDPPVPVIQRALDGVVSRLRYVTRHPPAAKVAFPDSCTWRLQYLDDEGRELEKVDGLHRALWAKHLRVSCAIVTPATWDDMHTLDLDWSSPQWYELLLDAQGALPKVGTALVLAATALEVFISQVLDQLARRSSIPPDIWNWLNKRKELDKNPTVEEQLDVLLKHLAGHSLKEDQKLWQAAANLRTARNKFVHGGVARVGGKEVDAREAARLVACARQVTDRIREWLPPELHWPKFERSSAVAMEILLP